MCIYLDSIQFWKTKMFKQNFKLLLYKSYNIKCIALVTMKVIFKCSIFKKKKTVPSSFGRNKLVIYFSVSLLSDSWICFSTLLCLCHIWHFFLNSELLWQQSLRLTFFKPRAGGSEVKASACNVGDPGSIPGLGRSPGEGNGNPLQYSCLENPMDGGAWWATVHGVAKSRTGLSEAQ